MRTSATASSSSFVFGSDKNSSEIMMHNPTTATSTMLHHEEKNCFVPCENMRMRTSNNNMDVTIVSSAMTLSGNSTGFAK